MPLIGITSVSAHFSTSLSSGRERRASESGIVEIVSLSMFIETAAWRRLRSFLCANDTVAPVISVDNAAGSFDDGPSFCKSWIRSRLLNMTKREFEYSFGSVSATQP